MLMIKKSIKKNIGERSFSCVASVTQAPWRVSTFKPLNSAWGKKRSAFVTALPQIRVETLIGSQANYKIKIRKMIYC